MENDNLLEQRWAPTLRWNSVRNTDGFIHTQANDAAAQTGVMVAFFPSATEADVLALEDGEQPHELHVTLAYLGNVGDEVDDDQKDDVIEAVTAWAQATEPMNAIVNGMGLFTTPSPVTYASIDAPALPAARHHLVTALSAAGAPPRMDHGYTPHMTLAYGDQRDVNPPALDLRFDAVVVAWAGDQTFIPLTGGLTAAPVPEPASLDPAVLAGIPVERMISSLKAMGSLTVSDRPAAFTSNAIIVPPEPASQPSDDTVKAFVTDINGRTLITGPATTIAAMREPTVDDITAEHMLWMHGRFVGAETPNRNGALWSAGDLEMSKGSVTNGPLNWLHDARHIIGSLAKADYVDPRTNPQAALEGAPMDPHITATAGIWKWIYPDEAYVVQQASDQQMLWYSMECISKEVSCVGDGGCGNTTSYSDYMAGAACAHVMQRASVRRFVDPVFLGGAVIVPPTRPGWAQADARVVKGANALAEAAFEQAGRPDVTASAWEQLMQQLVLFAQD